jgi:hypothetical protein
MDKQNMVYPYTIYYSPFKRKEILIHDTTWTKLEEIILSEICQKQKDKQCMIPLQIVKFTETENKMVLVRCSRKVRMGHLCLMSVEL